MIWGALIYFALDSLVAFFLGITVGVVAARVAKYLVALAISVFASLAYFIKRGLIAFSWQGIASSIKATLILNYHTYGIILGIIWGIGFIIGVVCGIKRKKREKEEIPIS